MSRIDRSGCKPFALPGARQHFAADRPARNRHMRLEVFLDFDAKKIRGRVTHSLTAIRALERLTFDAVEMDVTSAKVNGAEVKARNDGRTVTLELGKQFPTGVELTVEIAYETSPRRGLYFIEPDAAYPNRPRQAWTQGQDEDSRHWYPCLDAPAQKATSEVIANIPSNMTALSNGRLVEQKEEGGRRVFHYRLDVPHSPYLVTLVAGEFEEKRDRAGDTELRFLFPRGAAADAERSFANTKEMVALFEKLTGEKYPYGSYSQVIVSEFIFGGMENTSATTLTDWTLHDARAHQDYSSEPLVAHELAHQWFGDLLTCRDWPHGWLNEGFATYFEVLWKEHKEGRDEADRARGDDLDFYLDEDGSRYRRPIVARTFHEPIDLFDRHLYEKGGLVLHELRRRVGDELFFGTLKHYVKKHRLGNVETHDLARAFEEVTGRNLDRFFDQYVLHGGHPQLKVEVAWDGDAKLVKVRVRQTQEVNDLTPLFELPLDVRVVTAAGEKVHTLDLREADQTLFLPSSEEPKQVVIDPHGDVLATLDVDKPQAMWLEELANAKEARARTVAARHLGKDGSLKAIAALKAAMLKDPFWGVQADSAKALAAIRTPAARDALLEGLDVPHPKARRSVVKALGEFREDEKVAKVLSERAKKGDASYFVENELGHSLGKVRAPDALPVLKELLSRESFVDTIRVGALSGLAEVKTAAALELALPFLKYGHKEQARAAATGTVASLAAYLGKEAQALDALLPLLDDAQLRVQTAAIGALETLNDRRALGPLARVEQTALDGRARRRAREVMKELREGTKTNEELGALRDQVKKLEDETRGLKERLSKLETRGGGPVGI